jgi:hypothetical protein
MVDKIKKRGGSMLNLKSYIESNKKQICKNWKWNFIKEKHHYSINEYVSFWHDHIENDLFTIKHDCDIKILDEYIINNA